LGEPELDWPRAGLWKKVLGVMRLTGEQRCELLEQRRVLLTHLTEIARQRQEIINSLQVPPHPGHPLSAVIKTPLAGLLKL
jgi:hypothetical protein